MNSASLAAAPNVDKINTSTDGGNDPDPVNTTTTSSSLNPTSSSIVPNGATKVSTAMTAVTTDTNSNMNTNTNSNSDNANGPAKPSIQPDRVAVETTSIDTSTSLHTTSAAGSSTVDPKKYSAEASIGEDGKNQTTAPIKSSSSGNSINPGESLLVTGGGGAKTATATAQPKTGTAPISVTNPQTTKPISTGASGVSKTVAVLEKNHGVPTETLKLSSPSAVSKASSAVSKSLKKGSRKKRKTAPVGTNDDIEKEGSLVAKKKKVKRKKDESGDSNKASSSKSEKSKKPRKQTKKSASTNSGSSGASNGHSFSDNFLSPGLSAAQLAVQEQMRKALEEDQYSANGSIVESDTDDDDRQYMYKGNSIRLDRSYLLQAAKKYNWLGDSGAAGSVVVSMGRSSALSDDEANCLGDDDGNDEEENKKDVEDTLHVTESNIGTYNKKDASKPSKNSKNIVGKKKGRNQYTDNRGNNSNTFRVEEKANSNVFETATAPSSSADKLVDMERDEGSIFGQTTGSSNSTWVECDKCKKWRRLRGVVDERKLPPKWYCTMNKNDPERARCSAPEEEYDAANTPESAADARTRKHLRVWVRRLQCNEQYESRLPTLTRGKKRSVASSSKEPHEWVRCCNPSCGKWRSILRIMDAKQNVIDRTSNGEWYCVMNTWDEKTASCGAAQENLPAVGCPPWVLQDMIDS